MTVSNVQVGTTVSWNLSCGDGTTTKTASISLTVVARPAVAITGFGTYGSTTTTPTTTAYAGDNVHFWWTTSAGVTSCTLNGASAKIADDVTVSNVQVGTTVSWNLSCGDGTTTKTAKIVLQVVSK